LVKVSQTQSNLVKPLFFQKAIERFVWPVEKWWFLSFVRRVVACVLVLGAWLTATTAFAGGSGLNVIVVVNQRSTNSVQLGNDYCQLRGVRPQNLWRMTNWTGGAIDWSPTDFQNDLLNPLLATLASRGLTNQAQFVLLSMDIPYRVTDGSNVNSTTAALFYGFKTNTAPVDGFASCSLPDNTSNSYAYSELPAAQTAPNTAATNSFLAMMLTDTNLATAETTLARAVAADDSSPGQSVYLLKTSDTARNVRFVEFDNAIFQNRVLGDNAVQRTVSDSTSFTNLLGLQTGLYAFALNTNTFVPGAVADTLTSFGGYLFEPSGQTPLLAFLEAGAAGSYGTVVEPCAYTQKFPDPVDYFYQARGFSLAEAYYQSVLNPFQGLFVGEPLAAPFARPGAANWNSLTNGAILDGQAVLSPSFTSAATNLPLTRVDLFVDGTFTATMTNLPPSPGNVVSATINGAPVNYTVPAGATTASVAAGLAQALNANQGATHVLAMPFGDRVELQSQQIYVPGRSVTVTAGGGVGTAATSTTQLTTVRPAFLDTLAYGYQVVTWLQTPSTNDWIQATIIKTNGTIVTLSVTNSTGAETIGDMASSLATLINTTPALEAVDGVYAGDYFDYDPYGAAEADFFLYARTPGWPAAQIVTMYRTSGDLEVTPTLSGPLTDNVNDLRPKNHLYVAAGATSLPVNYTWDTTQVPDGYHELTAVAYEGTSVSTQTRVTRSVVVANTGLSASLTGSPAGTNVALGQNLQFTVNANSNGIASIELFTTGGSVGVVSNSSAAAFGVSTSYLGLGAHPFYALVTAQTGQQYRTRTVWYDVVPQIALSVSGRPLVLTWATQANRQYAVQATTNLAGAFQTLATVTATNSSAQWTVTNTISATFYRIQLN
jgi:uncharacterized protein (TIGR03790 family)